MRRALAILILFALAQWPTAPGHTQEVEAAALELVHQPVWHSPDDSLALRLRVSNEGSSDLEGFRLRVGVYDRVQSRSELHESFDAAPFLEPSSFPVDFDRSIPAGGQVTVTITDPVSSLATVRSAGEGGVFPLTVALQSGDETPLASLTTPLLYFPEEVETPLNVVMVLPLNEVPARAPDGTFEAIDDSWPLEVATRDSGWLRGIVGALVEATAPPPPSPPSTRRDRRDRQPPKRRIRRGNGLRELKLGLAPVPRLLDELADMADGFERVANGGDITVERSAPAASAASQTLADLQTLVGREGIQPILIPYAFPDLPTLTLEELAAQLDAAEDGMAQILGPAAGFSRRWLFPPAGRIDASTLAALRSLQAAERTFSSEAAFISDVTITPGCPEPFASFTCPVTMEAGDISSQGLVSDSKLQDLLGDMTRAEATSAIETQRFWADTVQVWAELPGTRDRVLYFALPTTWHPSPATAQRFFTGLRRAPWLKTATPDEALARGESRPRPITDFGRAATPTGAPSDPNLPEATDSVANLEALIPVAGRSSAQRQMLQRLNTNLLVARSRVWLDEELISRGLSYTSRTIDEVNRHFDAVQIGGAKEIALTSDRAPIQLLLQNQNSHPVVVRVYLESEGLELQEYVLDEIVPAERTRQIQIDAETRASGIFPLRVSVQTSDGLEIAQTSIRIRSTEFNEVALGVTIGALLFLIAFYVFRTLRRRSVISAGTDAG